MPSRRQRNRRKRAWGREIPSFQQLANSERQGATRAKTPGTRPFGRVRYARSVGSNVDSQLLNAFQKSSQDSARLSALQGRHEETMRSFESRLRQAERDVARVRGGNTRPVREMDGDVDMGERFGARAARAPSPPPAAAPMNAEANPVRAAAPVAAPPPPPPPAPMEAEPSPAAAIRQPARRDELMSAPAAAIRQPARRDEVMSAPGAAIVPYKNVERTQNPKRVVEKTDDLTDVKSATKRGKATDLTDIAKAGLSNRVEDDTGLRRRRVDPRLPTPRGEGRNTAPPSISRRKHATTEQQFEQMRDNDDVD